MDTPFTKYLSSQEVENIKIHKYKTNGYSWLDYKMNPFWEYCASKLPYKLTPNKVTVIGAISLYLGVMVLAFFDTTLSQPLNDWLYYLFALSVFLGQTFDAIDGKHARNTKRFSPLGQLMDHGCDAITNSCVTIYIAQACQFGGSRINMILLQGIVQIGFYVCTWEENRTGVINTHYNNFGVTETQILSMLFCLTPIYEQGFALISRDIIFKISVIDICVYITTTGLGFIIARLIVNVYRSEDRASYYTATKPFFSLIFILLAEVLVSFFDLYRRYLLLFVCLNGLYFGLTVAKMIISTMSKKKLETPSQESILYLISIIIGLIIPSLEFYVIVAQVVYIVVYFYRYFGSVILQLLEELKIETF